MASELATFREYLQSLSYELLECVTEDYVWLARFGFEEERARDFRLRRECCREECARRGVPNLYLHAESEVSPFAA